MNLLAQCQTFVGRILSTFHRNESGATLTEFVITLPIWIVMMGGLINMGQLGIKTTAHQMRTQKVVWSAAFEGSTGKNVAHMSPAVAGIPAVAEAGTLAANSDNPHQIASGADAVVMGGLEVNGSWGESYLRTRPLVALPGTDAPTPKWAAEDVLEVGSDYPNQIVNDGIVGTDWQGNGGGSLTSKIMSYAGDALSGSGALAALGAGNRYGEVFAAAPPEDIDLIFGNTVTANSHANLLVAPSPLTGSEARFAPFVLARLVAEGEENYAVMMNFGESEWDNDGAGSRDTPDSPEDDINDQREEDEEDNEERREDCQVPPADQPSYCEDFCDQIDGGC
jgi:hypothetical protein